jgi:CRISPR-associated protein Cmr5
MMQTRSQKLAQLAYRHVLEAKEEVWRADYGRVCLHVPALLRTNGLCQTIAFLQSKSNPSTNPYYDKFLQHFAEALDIKNWETVYTADIMRYVQLSSRAIEAAAWYKRFAEAVLKVELTDGKAGE